MEISLKSLENAGMFNGWRGCVGLYFTKRAINAVKKHGITEATSIKDAYNIYKNHYYEKY